MANKQINELTEKTNMVGEDLVPIYDSAEAGSEKTKKITLDDFGEYGTFTPEVADASSGGNVASIGTTVGNYIKIGRLAHIYIALANIDTTGLTAGNAVYIRNLPFTPNVGNVGTAFIQSVTITGDYVVPRIDSATGTILLKEMVSDGSAANIIVSDLADDEADILIEITYFTT